MSGEPAVIVDALLQESILAEGPKGEQAKKLFEEEPIDYSKVTTLKLEFKDILKICNLWQFKMLNKLQLSNNVIEKIEGLEELTTLTWLDLSFNRIEVIEGLERLINLTDLSLFSNKIKKLENMYSLKKLQIFSIGNNEIEEFSNIIYLRSFKNLHCLCIMGNPLAQNEGYELQVVAFLPSLQFLNYRLITEEMKAESSEKYRYEIDKIEAQTKANEERQMAVALQEERNALYTDAFVENLDEPEFFNAVFMDDKNGLLLQSFPSAKDIVRSFYVKFNALSIEWLHLGLKEHSHRQEEIAEFLRGTEETIMINRSLSINKVKQFLTYKDKILQEILSLNLESEDPVVSETLNRISADFAKESSALWNTLMELEMQLVDQVEKNSDICIRRKIIYECRDMKPKWMEASHPKLSSMEIYKEFQKELTDMVNMFIQNVKEFTSQLRELDEEYTTKMIEVFSIWFNDETEEELKEKGEEEEEVELDQDLLKLLEDEQTIINILQEGCEKHQIVIYNRELTLISRLHLWLTDNLKKFHDDEFERNRQRVTEINHFIDTIREEIDDMCGSSAVYELTV